MTVKVFRLHKEGSLSPDWHESIEYGDAVIRSIADPAGDTAKHQITSIPSPFARIDLIKTAFQYVVQTKQLEGNTIYHRMVSECLDIGEIFFNIDKLKDKVSIVSWDRHHDLDALVNSNNSKHQLLGKTLKLFLEQDAKTYNFEALNKIYLLKYTANGKILGGTSPITLFFSAADDLSFVDIKFLDGRLFDDQYNPLYKRDGDYQKFLNHYVKCYGLSSKMKFFTDYLELSNRNSTLFTEINNLKPDDFFNNYAELDTGRAGDVVEILGHTLRKHKESDMQSDFIIASDKYQEERKPLVLQNHFNKRLNYTNRPWDSRIAVPYLNSVPLSERKLPECDIQYPYLTVSDFLEPRLIRLIYPINKNNFQAGNLNPETGNGFLLPLKKEFFNFFNTDDLLNLQIGGKPMLDMRQNDNEVTVSLRIPIKIRGEYITFERTYSESDIVEADEASNKGKIIEKAFSIVIFPPFKVYSNENEKKVYINNNYRVMLIDTSIGQPDYQLSFHQNTDNTLITLNPERNALRSDKSQNGIVTTRFFVIEENFDYIQVVHAGATGVIIPKFKDIKQGTKEFTFAVDFGTTNTHIEYKTDNQNSQPFEITEKDYQIATLHNPNQEANTRSLTPIVQQFLHEFIPYRLETTGEFKFPQRTVLAESATWGLPKIPYALAVFNIPFTYEKRIIVQDSDAKLVTYLKWANYKDDLSKARIKGFLEEIAWLIHNKVLLNGGNLSKTKLMWFYPSSMSGYNVNELANIWKELCKNYIHTDIPPKKLLEAVAPFYYYKTDGVSAAHKPVASIDIGGGTTDIVVFKNNEPSLSTSFRFAGNSVFGDGYGGSYIKNGFYKKYVRKILDNLMDVELIQVIRDIEKSEKSDDIITAFFSFETNKRLKEKSISLPFSEWLASDGQLKIVFLVFYSAIIYHLAQFMKANNLESPCEITFSGTASKILNLADPTENLESLAKLTVLIFQDIYGASTIIDIKLRQCEQPKEITCKGGVLAFGVTHPDDMKSIFLGSPALYKKYPDNITYADIKNDDILNEIVSEIEKFLDLFFGLHQKLNFNNYFGVEPASLGRSKEILKKELMKFLKDGCLQKLDEVVGNEGEPLDETLFFYPLVGALHELAMEL